MVVVTVSSETRIIANGAEARVVRDTVTEDGAVTTREGSFEAGVDGVLPGIIMPADPAAGMSYRQEYYQGEAEDNGEVLVVGQRGDVPMGHFDDVVLTADTITLEPEVLEFKLYAPGVGMVAALGISGGASREELLSTRQVSDEIARAAGMAPLGEPYL